MLSIYTNLTNRVALKKMQKEDGAAAVEYGLLVALISAIIVGIVATLGGKVQVAFKTVSDALP